MLVINELIVLPKNKSRFHSLIKEANHELLISRQAIPNINFCNLLIETKKRGVSVKVLLTDPQYFIQRSVEEIIELHKVNYDMASYSKVTIVEKLEYIKYLQENDIHPNYINHSKYFLNHAKFMIMDSKKLFIGSAPNENTTRLDIGLVSNNPNYIRIFKNLFYTDLNHQEFKYEIIKDIGIAPYNLRLLVERLLLQAKKSIYLMFPVITDDSIILQILQNQMAKKVKVFVLCSPNIFNTDENESIDKKFNDQLVSFGATLKESYEPIIHNRCILIDPDVEHNQGSIAYIGSGNLKTSSLDKSREAALTTKDKKVINSLFSIFKELWVK